MGRVPSGKRQHSDISTATKTTRRININFALKGTKTMTSRTKERPADVIAANTLILELHVRGPMFKKGVSSKRILDRGNGQEEAENENGKINPDHIHISKDLIDQKQLKAIRDLTSQ